MSKTPRDNRLAIESGLQSGGTVVLSAGTVAIDQSLTGLAAGGRLIAHEKGTTLLNVGPGPAIKAIASGLGYASVDHVPTPIAAGDWVYRYQFDWQTKAGPPPLLCRVVKAKGIDYSTDPPPHKLHDAILRFRKAWPCGQPTAGSDRVALTVPPDGLSVGQIVYVTDGPSLADAARGEYRRVVAVEGQTVRLNRPLRFGYGPAVLADIAAVEALCVEGVRIESQPNGNSVTWGAMLKGCVGLKLIDVSCNGAMDIVTCGDAAVLGCSGPALQLNTTTDSIVNRSRFGAFYCEEATADIDATDCVFGENRDPAANCVAAFWHCDRLSFERVEVVGAGRPEWPPPSAFNVHGSGHTFVGVEVSASRGGSTILGGDGLMVSRFRSDGGIQFVGCKRASVSQVRGPYVELVPADGMTGNTIVDAQLVAGGDGWTPIACRAWMPGAA